METLKCPSTDDRIHTHTLKCYSAIKKEHNSTNCSNTGRGGEHCTKGSILDGKDKKWYHSYA